MTAKPRPPYLTAAERENLTVALLRFGLGELTETVVEQVGRLRAVDVDEFHRGSRRSWER